MYRVVIKYNNRKTLKILNVLSKHFGFTVVNPNRKKNIYYTNGVPIEKGNPNIDVRELITVFTETNIDPITLRESVWRSNR